MIKIDMDMPRYCSECPFLLYINGLCAFCMISRLMIKMSETDLKDGLCPLKKDVEAVPVNHGYWENGWICSECNYGSLEPSMPYCAQCGARMDGDKND